MQSYLVYYLHHLFTHHYFPALYSCLCSESKIHTVSPCSCLNISFLFFLNVTAREVFPFNLTLVETYNHLRTFHVSFTSRHHFRVAAILPEIEKQQQLLELNCNAILWSRGQYTITELLLTQQNGFLQYNTNLIGFHVRLLVECWLKYYYCYYLNLCSASFDHRKTLSALLTIFSLLSFHQSQIQFQGYTCAVMPEGPHKFARVHTQFCYISLKVPPFCCMAALLEIYY